MDSDKSDYVDAQEFKSIFSDVGEKYSDERMAEIDSMRGKGDSDGHLSASEFCDFMFEYFSDLSDKAFRERIATWESHLAASHRKLLLRRVFARMDVDKSGSVSLEEFKALGDEDVGVDQSDAFFKWIEGAVGNADGELTSDEWVPFVLEIEKDSSDADFQQLVDDWTDILEKKRRVTMLRQIFRKMDADSSGEVDLTEFNNLQGPDDGDKEALFMVYHYIDQNFGNSDGIIQMEEWVQGMRKMGEDLSEADFEAEVAKWDKVLTANQRTLWRGCFSRGQAHQFVIAARASGATHCLFVADAHTHPRSVGLPPLATGAESEADAARAADHARHLTDRGSAQCMVARDEWFGRLPTRKMVLTSPATRATETAMHMSGQAELIGTGDAPLITIQSLHAVGVNARAEEIAVQKAGASLRTLLDTEGGETAFGGYAEATCEEITTKFREQTEKDLAVGHRERETYVAMFGHAAFLNSVAYAIATAAGLETEALDKLLDMRLGEAEGVLVPLFGKGKSAIHLARPP